MRQTFDKTMTSRLGIWRSLAPAAALLVAFTGLAGAQGLPGDPLPDSELDRIMLEEPPVPALPRPADITQGTGKSFSAILSDGSTVTLTSDQPVRAAMRLLGGAVMIYVERTNDAASARLSLTGLSTSTLYNVRQDGAEIAPITSSSQGVIAYTLDITRPRSLLFDPRKSTVIINANLTTSDPAKISCNAFLRECTVLQNLAEPVLILANDILLKGAGRTIAGSGQSVGIDISGRQLVTVRDVIVRGFQIGVSLNNANFCTITNSTFTANLTTGINQFGGSNTKVEGTSVSEQSQFTSYVTLSLTTNFFARRNFIGTVGFQNAGGQAFELGTVKNSTFTQNAISVVHSAFDMRSGCIGNVISTNSIALTGSGIGVQVFDQGNRFSSNTFDGGFIGLFLRADAAGRTIADYNTLTFNQTAVRIDGANATVNNNRFTSNLSALVFDTPSFRPPGNNVAVQNFFGSNSFGIRYFAAAHGEKAEKNTFVENQRAFAFAGNANNNVVDGNFIDGGPFKTGVGILWAGGNQNAVVNNTMQNSGFAMHFNSPAIANNLISHNNFLSPVTIVSAGPNSWNLPYPGGGNNWAPFAGAADARYGDKQDLPVKDGVADAAFVINANNKDAFPFMKPSGWLVDTIPPKPIGDLDASNIVGASADLTWEAPGNNWNEGNLHPSGKYDIRVSPNLLTQTNFEAAPTQVILNAGPVTGVNSFVLPYPKNYIAIKSTDAAGNTSSISNLSVVYTATSESFFVAASAEPAPIVTLESPMAGMQLALASPADQQTVSSFILQAGLTQVSNVYSCTPSMTFPSTTRMIFSYAPFSVPDPSALVIVKTVGLDSTILPSATLDTANKTVFNEITSCSFFVLATKPLDALPPRTTINIGQPTFGGLPPFATSATPLSLTAVDDGQVVGDAAGAGVAQTQFSIDNGSLTSFTVPFTAAGEGIHTIRFFSTDINGNVEAVQTSTVAVDNASPNTALAFVGGLQASGASPSTFFASSDTRVSLAAVDPVVNGVASGVALTRFQDNGGAFQNFSSSFALSIGSHALTYQSQDNLGNLEAARATTILIDAAPPVSTAAIAAPLFVAADGTRYITPATPITLSAQDPAVNGSGVDRIEVAVDGAGFAAYTAALTLAEGRHTILFRAVDRVGNVEAAKTLQVQSDATPPSTALQPSGTFFITSGQNFAPAGFTYALPAQDPVVGAVASGVAFTRYQDNGGAFQTFSAPFSLAEGIHNLTFQSRDNVDNLELLQSATVFVDATAPVTAVAIGSPASGTVIAPTTPVSFSATDPLVNGVASGVDHIEVNVDALGFTLYTAALTLSSGAHTVAYRSVDHAGNVETVRSLSLTVDGAPPAISITSPLAGQSFVATKGAIPVNFSVTDDLDPSPSLSAVLVELQDRGSPRGGRPSVVPVATGQLLQPLDLDDGLWQLRVSATDFALNSSAVSSGVFEVVHDTLAPRTSIAVGNPQAPGGSGPFVTRMTSFILTSIDDLVLSNDGIGLGVALQQLTVDGAARASFVNPPPTSGQVFSSSFSLSSDADGLRVLAYSAQDVLGNVESARTMTVAVDNTPPQTTLSLTGGSQVPGDAAASIYASSDTLLAFAAVDPVINGVASGVSFTRFQDNGGAFQTFASAFNLPEGAHNLGYQSEDRVLNLEVTRSTTVLIDATPPVTSAQIGTPLFIAPDGSNYITPATPVTFTATDPISNGVASGVDRIEVAIDGGIFAAYSSALTFAEGPHTILFRAIDKVGNTEPAQVLRVRSDNAPPATSLTIAGGQQFPGPGAATFYASSDTRLALTAVDPLINGVASGLALTRNQDNGGAFQSFTAPFILAEGSHALAYQSQDNIGNLEVARSTTVLIDATAPVSTAAIGAPLFIALDGANYITPATPIALSAADPIVNGVASGLQRIEAAVDGGPFALHTTALTLPEGEHVISFRAIDNVANAEAFHSLSVRSDNTAPVTSAQIGMPLFIAPDGSNYITPTTPVTFTAADPVSNGVASGVNRIEVALDGGPFAAYSSALTFAEGLHTILFRAIDKVGNAEIAQLLRVQSDNTPPATSLAVSGGRQFPGQGAATFYASSDTRLALPAVDPVVNGVASGVALTRYQDNGAAFQNFDVAFVLAEGSHALAYQSRDNIGNLEVARSTTVLIDATAPVSSATIGAPLFIALDGANYITPATPIALSAADPVVNGVASELQRIEMAVDGGPFALHTTALTLPEGEHVISFRAIDNVANAESFHSLSVRSDNTAPVTSAHIGAPLFVAPDGTNYVTPATPVTFTASDPVVNGAASGVARTEVAVDGGAFAEYSAALTFAEGSHTILFRSIDAVGNAENAQTILVQSDDTAPITSLEILDGRQFPGPNAETFYASSDTRLALPAVDPVANAVASGLALTQWQDNGGAFQPVTSAFSLPEGAHALGYRSQDRVNNLEVLRSTTVLIDATPPVTSARIGTPLFVAVDGTNYVSPGTPITFTAEDPVVQRVASGVNRIEVAVDEGAFAAYSSALTFTEGRHTVRYRSLDNVGNVEITRTLSVQADDTAPLTDLGLIGGRQFPGPSADSFYASSDTRLSLPATDPTLNSVASGVAFTRYQDNGGAFQNLIAPIALSEGSHALGYQSKDNVENFEVLRSTTVLVDATAPVSTAAIGSPLFIAAGGARLITPATPVTLSAADLAVNGVASGVRRIEAAVDGGAYALYAAALTFGEGAHTILFRAVDNVGNAEAARTLTVQSDDTPPVTVAEIGAPQFVAPDGTNYITPATPISFRAVDTEVNGVAAGTSRTEVAVDGGAFTAYSGALTFAEGRHTILFRSIDTVGNTETARTLRVQSDDTAPLTSLAVLGGHQSAGQDASAFYASPDTRFGLPAVDPAVGDVASGLAFTQRQDNGGAFQAFTSAFALAEGAHLLAYRSQDRVDNLEVLRSTTVLIDAAAPISAYAIAAPQFIAADGTIYITPQTPITLSAVDPALPTGQPGSGVSRIEAAVDGGAFSPYGAALTLAQGLHTILFKAVDNVANVEAVHTLLVRSDATPPQTSLALAGGRQAAGPGVDSFYASADTRYALPAVDPIVNGAASGVAFTRYQDNGGSFQSFAAAFQLTEGSHALSYQSQDNVGHLEVLRSTTVLVDATAPVSAAAIGSPLFIGADGVNYVTPATPVTLSAVDPVSNGVASGVERIEVSIDGGAFAAYASALSFAEGRHAILFRAIDRVGNVEATRRLDLQSDDTRPATAFTPSGALFTEGGRSYAPAQFTYALPAQDPLVNNVASGVAFTRYRTAQGAYQNFTSTFSLSEGVRRVEFQSQDNVGNLELLKSATVFVDATAPVSALAVGNPKFDAGNGQPVFVAAATPLTLSAMDTEVQEAASGVRQISFRRDSDAFAPYVASFALSLPDGIKTVDFFAADNVDNTEATRSAALALDNTAAITSLAVLGGRQFAGPNAASFYASSDTRIALLASDPVTGGVASGLALTQYQDNGGAFQVFASAFSLPEGAHLLAYQSQDRVENLEVLRSTTALIDATAPVSSATVASPRFIAADGTIYITPETQVTLSAVDPSLPTGQPGSEVSRIEVAIDGGTFSAYSSALTLAEGRHTILYRAVDNVANVEAIRTLNVQSDATPPLTSLQVIGGKQASSQMGDTFYASLDTRYALPAGDPAVNGAASGVAFTRYQDNGGAFTTFASPFSLAEGSHALNYQSQDNVQNLEVARSTTVLVDATAPVSSATIGSPLFVGADGVNYVTPATPVTLSAFDPASSGVASGVDRVEVAVDGGTFAAYVSALTFAEGRHTVLFRALDRVGNIETTRRLDIQSDDTSPLTTFTPSGALFTAGDRSYAPAQFTYALPAQDPVAGDVASGVAFTRFRTTAGTYQNFGAAFSLSEGIRRIEFQSQDNVGNIELLKSATVFVDATAPASALSVGEPKFDPGNGLPMFVAAATPLTLSALDPEIQEVASGVRQISFHRDGDPFGAYAAPFALPLPDGFKTIGYFAADNVGNAEVARSASIALDDTAPATSLAVLGGRQFPGPNATSFYASSDTRLALPAVDPTVNGVASGLALTQWQDNGGAFQAFTAAFALPEGAHTLGYRSQDRVQNMEVPRSTTVLVDAAPPVTTAHIGAPSFAAGEGTNYITPATPVTFTAVDPTVEGVASGVGRIEVAVDGGPFAVYSSALTFAEGRHVILYRAIDNVANVEAIRTLNVQSDATPPEASLAIGAPNFDPGEGRPVFIAAASVMTLTAQDPVVMNVASGVRAISFRSGGDLFGTYTAPFALQAPDGLKTLAYFATDNVGNREITRSTTVALDDTPPLTSLAVLGGRQFPGPNATSFYASSDTRLALPAVDPTVNGVASGLALTQWQDNGGAFQDFVAAFALPEGAHVLGYRSRDRVQNLEVSRSTTVLVDAAPPVTTAHIGAPSFAASDGTNYITPATPVAFSAVDSALPGGQPGSGVSRIEVAVDGGPFTIYSAALTFAEGRHTILYRAVDNVANVSVVHTLLVQSDATPPLSSLVIGAPQFQLPNVLLVSTRTPFTIAVIDPVVHDLASGVKDTQYRVSDSATSPAAFSAFTAPFTMAGANVSKVIEFFSRDNVLNSEVVKSSTVLLDSTPPEVALLSPASCGAGICRVLKGRFPVLGAARDLHFESYRLEFAPGQDAATGFALISSGTLAVSSGTLGQWDATALSGWFTVLLTAADLVANTTSVALNIFAGDPGQSLVLGNHEIFNMPEGVAAGTDGKIYVADRNNDRIAVFSSTGVLLASFGGRKNEDDEHKESTATLRLNKPSGVAVDAGGNVYVADTNRDRVLKLSSDGRVLFSLPGQFQHPAGVAVDAADNIYVADTGNGRVQVFSSTGAFNFQFNLPPVPVRLDGDDDDAAGSSQMGKPFAVAVDAAGNIYVADPEGGRALKFGAAGELLLTIPISGDKPGSRGQPFGVAVSSKGDCLLVSDRMTSRILKFDFLGSSNLIFGSKGKIRDDDAPTPGSVIVFKKPMGLALDDQGNLFVADRNNNRVQKLGLPTGEAPLVVPPPKPEDEHVARDVVDVEDGGKVERRDLAAVDIPAGAVAADLKITVSTPAFSAADDSNRRRAAEDAQLKTASPPIEYGPEGTTFNGEVTLTLPYSPELAALQNIDSADLKVRYWNPGTSQWEELESVVDPKTRTVKAKTTHFSLYQVFSGTVSAAAIAPLAADAAFTFRDAYAFPNPVRGSGPITIRIQTGLADSVEVRVYDVSGRKIHSSSNFSLNPNLDDGNGKGAQYTYDHVWDVSGVGSGVYQYVITAKKSGQSDIHKTGRVGVVK